MKKLAIFLILVCFIASGINAQQNDMVRINGGTFTMGSPANEAGRRDDEVQHRVTVSPFSMSMYPVTQREYREIMGENPSWFRGNNLPVEGVTWYEAVEYCNRRSHKEGLTLAYRIDGEYVTWNRGAAGYRLPTEAEWEYACRAGTTTAYNTGNNITKAQANFDWQEETINEFGIVTRLKGAEKTTPVGSFAPNAWGLYDMHGNVLERCWDWYGPYETGAQTNPTGVVDGNDRVVRGGSWYNFRQGLRSASRGREDLSIGRDYIGFRVVRP
ncbi:MAG: formylglycine-generating enzyme family protein [Treponema sp.]|jgi:formylglycine-generating enzyme required for sulfatase activity|nr:formylglycine-generating enzyme family protein [Treponema sp.]